MYVHKILNIIMYLIYSEFYCWVTESDTLRDTILTVGYRTRVAVENYLSSTYVPVRYRT